MLLLLFLADKYSAQSKDNATKQHKMLKIKWTSADNFLNDCEALLRRQLAMQFG